MRVYLGLGSNLGDRREHLARAIDALEARRIDIRRVSPVVESPALLPDSAPSDWNRPFLNLVLDCAAECTPEQLRLWIDEIQSAFGRINTSHWSPRPIDIDILLWGRDCIATERLTIPHRDLTRRSFVLAPLAALAPRLTVPGGDGRHDARALHRARTSHPVVDGIVNVTPDSFSDGGRFMDWPRIEPHVEAMIEAGVHIIDVGGESTRPGAAEVDPEQEWSRVSPVIERLVERLAGDRPRPLLSLDTRHAEVAAKGLELGVDIVNDVSGLTCPDMVALARDADCDWVAMHHVTIPADPQITLPDDEDPFDAVEAWLLRRMEAWDAAGLNLERIIFDPGIGFGKNRLQSLRLLRRAGEFRRHGLRVLVGHSRKSFMKSFMAKTSMHATSLPSALPCILRAGRRHHPGARRAGPRRRLPRVVAPGGLSAPFLLRLPVVRDSLHHPPPGFPFARARVFSTATRRYSISRSISPPAADAIG